MTLCLIAYGQLAFEEGDAERAALLVGAAEGLRRRAGLRPWPTTGRGSTELVGQIRQDLGPDRFDEVFATGTRLGRREAVAAARTGEAATAGPTH